MTPVIAGVRCRRLAVTMAPVQAPRSGAESESEAGALPRATADRVRLVCLDDDTLIREGVARLLANVEVVATFSRVEHLLEASPEADVALVDLWLGGATEPTVPVMQGMRGVAAVAAAGYRVLIYTNERRRQVLAGCMAAGAMGLVHKSEPLTSLQDAVRAVALDQPVITPALAGLAEIMERRGGMGKLSPRQIEVLRGRARGETYKTIGARLFISPKTAEEYMAEVTRRFSEYLREHSAADLERLLGIGPGDLLEHG